jgi:predicted MPP superfamily phosphohydrolase
MFFIFFLGVLSLLHLYLFHHLSAAWPNLAWVFATVLLILLSLPFLMAYFRRRRRSSLARICALAGFSWIGILFVADCIFGLLGLYDVAASVAGLHQINPQITVFVAAILTLSGVIYGCFEAQTPRLKSVRLPLSKPRIRPTPIRLVQITDLHLGYVADAGRLRALVDRINDLNPDLIVSTGDLFDSDFEKMEPMVDILVDLRAAQGKFAISGNHEVYENLESGLDLTRRAGFRVLQGESVEVTPNLYVAGVDDAEALEDGVTGQHEKEALKDIPGEACTILLKHRPTVIKSSIGRFDLQLSGHTHGGQIFPFSLLTRLVYRFGPGLSRVGPDSWLYLSRGTGTWGPQFRILAPPEVTLIELTGSQAR